MHGPRLSSSATRETPFTSIFDSSNAFKEADFDEPELFEDGEVQRELKQKEKLAIENFHCTVRGRFCC